MALVEQPLLTKSVTSLPAQASTGDVRLGRSLNLIVPGKSAESFTCPIT
jgi:hypothetical protein